jgi:hypothetical protein
MRRILTSAGLAVGLLLLHAGHASADAGGNATTGRDRIEHSAHNDGRTSGATGSGGGVPECTFKPIDIPATLPVFDENGTQLPTDGGGRWYEKSCGDNVFAGVFYITPRQPSDLAAEAWRYLLLPLPAPTLSPSGDQIVNLPTWLWTDPADWVERRSTLSVPGVTVTVVARPEAAVWSLGDGSVLTCDGPGAAYDPTRPASAQSSTCTHTFARSSASHSDHAFAASVAVRWRAAWTVAGAPGGGDLGVIERTTAFPVRVGEVQAINTAAG